MKSLLYALPLFLISGCIYWVPMPPASDGDETDGSFISSPDAGTVAAASNAGSPPASPPKEFPGGGSQPLATGWRVHWRKDFPNMAPGIWEHGKFELLVDSLPLVGVTPHWQPRATIGWYYTRVDFNTGTTKTVEILKRQAATIQTVDSNGFTVVADEGSVIRVEGSGAFAVNLSAAAKAAFATQASTFLNAQSDSSPLDGAAYESLALVDAVYAELPPETWHRLQVAEEGVPGYGLRKRLPFEGGEVKCLFRTATSELVCALDAATADITAIEDAQLHYGVVVSDANAESLQSALWGNTTNSSGEFGPMTVHCTYSKCTVGWTQERQ